MNDNLPELSQSEQADMLINALQAGGEGQSWNNRYGSGAALSGRVGASLPNGLGAGLTGTLQRGQPAQLHNIDASYRTPQFQAQGNFSPQGKVMGGGVTVPMGGGNLTARYDRQGMPMVQNQPVGQEHTAQDPLRNSQQLPIRNLLQLMYSKDF